MNIHSAKYILPITRPPIENGAVVCKDETIIDLGTRQEIAQKYPQPIIDHPCSIILPGLINTHVHFELSALRGKIKGHQDFVDWVRQVVTQRQNIPEEVNQSAIAEAITFARKTGTVAVGDVSNTLTTIPKLMEHNFFGIVFLEVLGFMNSEADEIFKNAIRLLQQNQFRRMACSVSAHAPYSTSAELLKKIATDRHSGRSVKTIHLAESADEVEFLKTGKGKFLSFLQWRTVYDPDWTVPHQSPVKYVNHTGYLDQNTLAVHLVQTDDDDLEILKEKHVSVCVCPRSNHQTGVGQAPIQKYVDAGLNVSIGTDSLASNEDLDLFNEMRALRKWHSLDEATILKMATIQGAHALRLGDKLGSIEPNKSSHLIELAFITPPISPYLFFQDSNYKLLWL